MNEEDREKRAYPISAARLSGRGKSPADIMFRDMLGSQKPLGHGLLYKCVFESHGAKSQAKSFE